MATKTMSPMAMLRTHESSENDLKYIDLLDLIQAHEPKARRELDQLASHDLYMESGGEPPCHRQTEIRLRQHLSHYVFQLNQQREAKREDLRSENDLKYIDLLDLIQAHEPKACRELDQLASHDLYMESGGEPPCRRQTEIRLRQHLSRYVFQLNQQREAKREDMR